MGLFSYNLFSDKKCINHIEREAFNLCWHCKEHFCRECLDSGEGGGYYHCKKTVCQKSKESSRKAADAARVAAEAAVVASHAKIFCPVCMAATTSDSSGSCHRINDHGWTLISGWKTCKACKSVEARAWTTFGFLPIFPHEKYRVIWGDGNSFLGGRRFVSRRLK